MPRIIEFMKQFVLVFSFVLFTFTTSAQEANKVDIVTVKIDDSVYIIRVAENNRLKNFISDSVYPRYKEGFSVESTEVNCDLLFQASAIKKSRGEVLVTLYIGTREGKKSSSFDKQISLKKGEEKDLKLKSKLKCMGDKQYSVSVSY